MLDHKRKIFSFGIWHLCLLLILSFGIYRFSFAQEGDLELNLDIKASTYTLPKIFKPNVDLSGRGASYKQGWPQNLAAAEALDRWQQEIGFSGMYRLQYDLWEIWEAAKSAGAREQLLDSYESVFRKVTDSGGVVIANIFGTPAGMGRVLDKTSAPRNLKALKGFIKSRIRSLSCEKKYNIWYEVWSAPDREDFFLGRKQDYLNLYRAVAEIVRELQAEYKIHIPLGGPSSSWWFQNDEKNTVITPEKSLIYSLIKFCYRYRLPLDFITWHSYSSDPQADKEVTRYKKSAVALIRDWLSYFRFDRGTALIVSEWNYDSAANMLPERGEKSNVCASYIFSRLKNMHEAGLDCQVYFALEDFQSRQEDMYRNVGVFSFASESSAYKGEAKVTYNAFRMLAQLGNNMFTLGQKQSDEFAGALAGKSGEKVTVIIYNYIDPAIGRNYISRNISTLSSAARKAVLKLAKSDKLDKVIRGELNLSVMRMDKKLKALLKKAQELNVQAQKYVSSPRKIKVNIKNLKDSYRYQRYTIDSSCVVGCEFMPLEEKDINATDSYQEMLVLEPYSVQMIVLKKRPKEQPQAQIPAQEKLVAAEASAPAIPENK